MRRATVMADHRPSFAGLKLNRVLGEQLEPGPFQRKTQLHPSGVHLHWALPDGLCHGESPAPGSEPVFPLIPNRWLVVRLQRPVGSAPAPACRAWVVESDSITDRKKGQAWPGSRLDDPDPSDSGSYVRYVGRVTELADVKTRLEQLADTIRVISAERHSDVTTAMIPAHQSVRP
jgi:hypothetical protein